MNSITTSSNFNIPVTTISILSSSFQPTHLPPSLQPIVWTPGDIVLAVFVALILSTFIMATIVGNALVITAIFTERGLRTVANYLIASLAVADLLVASLVMPILAVKEVSHRWVLGAAMCEAWVSMDVLCCTASILHLLAIAIDRYWAVTRASYIHDRPVRPIVLMIVLSWVVSALLCVPSSFVWWNDIEDIPVTIDFTHPQTLASIFNKTVDNKFKDGSTLRPKTRSSLRELNNPDDTGVCKISQDWGYTVYSTMAAFFIPLIAIIIIYAKVYGVARRRIRKKPFTSHKATTINEDEQRNYESTDDGCLEESLNSESFDRMTHKGMNSDLNRGGRRLKFYRRIGLFTCFRCKLKTQDKNGFSRKYSQEQSTVLQTNVKHLNDSLREATTSGFSLTPTSQQPWTVFAPPFASSATATTTLTAALTDPRPSDIAEESGVSYGLVPVSLSVGCSRIEGFETDLIEHSEAKDESFSGLVDKECVIQRSQTDYPTCDQNANDAAKLSQEKNNFLKTEESNENSCKSKRPMKRQSALDEHLPRMEHSTEQTPFYDSLLSSDPNKLAGADDSAAPDKQFSCRPKRSITFQTCNSMTIDRQSGLLSSTDDFQDQHDEDAEDAEDAAFYDETGDDGDDETDANDKSDELLSAKRFHSTDYLKENDSVKQLRLPSLQFSSQPQLSNEEQTLKPVQAGQRRQSSHKRHHQTALHLHFRSKQSSRKQRPTRQAKERRAKEKRELARERKAARTLAIITGSFVVCWLPFFITALVMPFCGDSCYMPPIIESVITWLGYLNSGLNPVIYTIFNVDFRVAFKKIVFGKRHKL